MDAYNFNKIRGGVVLAADDEPKSTACMQRTPICETCDEEIDVYGCGLECSHPDVVLARENLTR